MTNFRALLVSRTAIRCLPPIAACLLKMFGLAHFGKKDIRMLSCGPSGMDCSLDFLFGLTGNLLVPMMAHGLFDLGGVIYFQ